MIIYNRNTKIGNLLANRAFSNIKPIYIIKKGFLYVQKGSHSLKLGKWINK